MKNFFAIVGSLAAAMIIIMLFELLSNSVHPFPKDLDLNNKFLLKEYMSTLPLSVFAIVLSGYIIASFIAGVIIKYISPKSGKIVPLITGIILTSASIVNLYLIPHPLWFIIINVILCIPMALIGHSLFRKIPDEELMS
jgi:hypothetical protein